MIVQLIMEVLYYILNARLFISTFKIPAIPDSAMETLDYAMSYISAGVGLLANYTDIAYLLALFGILITVDIVIALYHFVMWIIRKFPVASE